MDPELREQILQLIREELTIDVSTESVYIDDRNNSNMYRNVHTVKLILGDEVISSVWLD